MKDKNTFEDKRQLNALEMFAPKIREILIDYKGKRKLSFIAKTLGFHPSRLTEMITKDNTGKYKRIITPYYLAKLMESGFITANQLLEGRKLEDLPERLRIYFERMSLPTETIRLVLEAKKRGINIEMILNEILYPTSN